ncbi:pyruvate ferredoxin oxidoreductase [Synergistes jonesii]|uniref:Pyruvate ferredoxin oxidoreductase n=1 Tax=Synergistes jonesii TaxID=2754 RepID=A0A073IVU8_9BACT|nr:pyruvate ferredoxin oxidoreductase [Synergistes jonesii]KEJ93551.1 pyruvate ferredoxin oxidoreductase [Synergistes jonesii]OFB61391.1 pyruvate ferredoxin oxidoreductase [Synergistes jonesii]OFB65331.1 pyruvate ferredoxin oxidoreductase [Synergistes jonesii]OFB68681.1 pyruvate ferredoxin oxidoreductase [Synergistes jonesii]OFB69347.1 pyruvate ferredoxin oxidoreductase [Synergistes jonesii]
MSNKIKVMTSGNLAFAEAMRQIDPDVVAAYPITPSTEIPMKFADFVANGRVTSEYIAVESEHSAISACVGASAAGARVMTASSANGVALMHEIFPIAASFRAPIVFGLVNRSLGAPVNIHCDHSDSMPERDSGWIQIYCEDAQEVYDSVLLAVRLAEDPRVLTPVFVCQDGFITSHCYEAVELLSDETVKNFVGERTPQYPLLDTDAPVSYGSFTMSEYYFEIKRNQMEGMNNVLSVYAELAAELERETGRNYRPVENYRADDADYLIVVMSSAAGVVKDVVDELREEGVKAGALRVRFFRPFPREELASLAKGKRGVAVLDRSASIGGTAPLSSEVKSALYALDMRVPVQEYIFGLGGRDLYAKDARAVFEKMIAGDYSEEVRFIGLLEKDD